MGMTRSLARLARVSAEAERPGADYRTRSEARLLETTLGANPAGIAALGWRIAEPRPAAPVGGRARFASRPSTARSAREPDRRTADTRRRRPQPTGRRHPERRTVTLAVLDAAQAVAPSASDSVAWGHEDARRNGAARMLAALVAPMRDAPGGCGWADVACRGLPLDLLTPRACAGCPVPECLAASLWDNAVGRGWCDTVSAVPCHRTVATWALAVDVTAEVFDAPAAPD